MIRRAENKDIPGIMKLLLQVNMVHHLGRPDLFKGPATKYNEEELSALLRDDRTPIFVYTDDQDRVLAHCFCVLKQFEHSDLMTDIKTLYIDDLCVEETCRGQHIGQAVYAFVKDYAAAIGCYNITLNVWTLNPAALKFYEKCGLVPQKIGMETIL
ncbi:MAG: GNAT family N-acetyltransferase [Clostridia bacterium]|nr:GNAT family N-acetyltransferase [Clostridia bacterium]